MNREHLSELKRLQALAPLSRTASANGVDVDTTGYDSSVVAVSMGDVGAATGSNLWSFSLQEADDNGAGSPDTYTNVADVDTVTTDDIVVTNGIFLVVDAPAEENIDYSVGYKGAKKWLRVVATLTGTLTSVFGASYELGNASNQPATIIDGVTLSTI